MRNCVFVVLVAMVLCSWVGRAEEQTVSQMFDQDRQVVQLVKVQSNDTVQVNFYNAKRQLMHLLRKGLEFQILCRVGSGGTCAFDLRLYDSREMQQLVVLANGVVRWEGKTRNLDGLTALVRCCVVGTQPNEPDGKCLGAEETIEGMQLRIVTYPWPESSSVPTWMVTILSFVAVLVLLMLFYLMVWMCTYHARSCQNCGECCETILCCCAFQAALSD